MNQSQAAGAQALEGRMGKVRRSMLGCTTVVAALVASSGRARSQSTTDARPQQQNLEDRVKALENKQSSSDFLRSYWKDGLRFETSDKKIQLKIGGRVHFDSQWNSTDDDLEASSRYKGAPGDATQTSPIGPFEDGYQVRRARLFLSGLLYEHVEFKAQFDFAKGAAAEKDVYAGLVDLGDWIPNLRAGHQLEPFGLDTITSDNDLTFIEFDPISDALGPVRNPGFLIWKNLQLDDTPRVTWAAGAFRTDSGDNGVSSGDGAYNFDARVTGTPLWEEDGAHMVHVGLAASRRGIPGRGTAQTLTLSSKPAADLLPTVLSTGAIPADDEWKYGAETACIWGPLSLQGEYILDKVNVTSGAPFDDPTFPAWYAQLAYTLTGEHRRWNAVEAVPQNPRPGKNAFQGGGWGAWEIALRYSVLDLSDGDVATGGIEGGSLEELTVGLNWYLNPNARVMLDASHVDAGVDDPALGEGGAADILQMRWQVAF